ncbi:transglycosylase domain-containing protein [Leifsonia poae]|uniref:Carboxypeptidase n=1 Tax=Leifsonia poae TaxID=110933 RepID=A0A9W6M112_9MICO|nr:transglycosylase domain-containing protein [Leifsonia poae]GLJ77234.1 carboxypeptidase [Leifsonia poae]
MTSHPFSADPARRAEFWRRFEPLRSYELEPATSRIGLFAQFAIASLVAAVLVAAAVLPGLLGMTGVVSAAASGFEQLPATLSIAPFAQNSTLYAKQGGKDVPIASFYAQNRQNVSWTQVSQTMKDATIAAEDPRYYSDGPIDVLGTVRGALSTVVGNNVQGGSSITQQYVKNVEVQRCDALTDAKKLQACYQDAAGVTLQRKVQEMRYAVGIEKKYTKQEILLGYLNVVGFGGQIYGVASAAHYYFNTTADKLTLPQAATLVAMLNNPANLRIDEPKNTANGAANGYKATKDRRDYVLDRMYVNHKITKAQRDAAKATPVSPTIMPSTSGCATAARYNAAFFCDYVRDVVLNDPAFGKTSDDRWATLTRGGLKIYTTLNLDLQATAQQSLSSYIPATEEGIDLGASNVSMETGTGRIVTMVENRAFNNTDQPSPGTTAVNYNTDQAYGGSQGFQTGSTFKAFDLAAWLESGHSLYDSIDATQHDFPTSDFTNTCADINGPDWPVTNDEGSASYLSVLSATAESVNTAFAKMGTQVDLCSILNAAKSLGVHPASSANPLTSVPSMILGVNYLSPLTMATAYAGIANGGVVCTPVAIDKIINPDGTSRKVTPSSCTQGLRPDIAAGVTYALQGVMSNGTATSANPDDGVPIMGKTGTTDDSLQNWLVTSTSKVATATWVGNVSGQTPLRSLYFNGVGGGDVKFEIARPILQAINGIYGGSDFTPPSDAMLYGSQITVPDVTGKTTDEATKTLQGLGLTVSVDPTPVDGTQPAGTIAATSPTSDTTVAAGTQITLQTSNGLLAAVPSGLIGSAVTDAQAALTAAGFTNVVVQGPGGATPTPGASVADVSPGEGSQARKDAQIVLTTG